MKCFVHQDEDAVAVCKICGKGACNNCAIILSGDSYCKTCLETGRVRTTGVQTRIPVPAGTPSRTHFLIGSVGAIIAGVAALMHMILGFLTGYNFLFGYMVYPYGIWMLGTGIPLATGLILAGIGYLGVSRNYGLGIGTAGYAFSIVAALSLLSLMVIGAIFSRGSWGFSYDSPSFFLAITNSIIFGTTQILWGVAHIITRRFTGNSSFALATGITLILSGALTASVLVSFSGIALFLPAEIMVVILFLTSSLPEPITLSQVDE